jgi:hypothetical protein
VLDEPDDNFDVSLIFQGPEVGPVVGWRDGRSTSTTAHSD